jgi:energy-coupling factor transporter ATP-binding protein EcfA2
VRNLTALENVLMGSLGRLFDAKTLFGLFPRAESERAREALDMMGIAHKAAEPVFCLSGGERQRVAIARTLLQHPRVVLADEFASDLDLALASEILARIRRAAEQENITFIMSMHRIGLARQFGDDVLALSNGAIVPDSSATRSSKPSPLRRTVRSTTLVPLTIRSFFARGACAPGFFRLAAAGARISQLGILGSEMIPPDMAILPTAGAVVGNCRDVVRRNAPGFLARCR